VPREVLAAAESVRGSLPNRYCDPGIAADLFEEVIDEFLLCDDLGMNVLAIEHHAGINSLLGANPMLVGILARQTKKVRILSLGTLVSLREDPVRVAEEYATADVISRGRLEIGFVKSGGTEMASGNANPVRFVDRFWEAIDVIKLALTAHDGPVSFEGKYYTHRHINLWPPPYQRPHPQFWAATGDPVTSAECGRRGYVNAQVRPQVSGYLLKRNYREGTVVRRGEVLFEIDRRPFDLIVSNPPYITSSDIEKLPRGVREYEPLTALDGGLDGLSFHRRILEGPVTSRRRPTWFRWTRRRRQLARRRRPSAPLGTR
jgi:hypothetical protein